MPNRNLGKNGTGAIFTGAILSSVIFSDYGLTGINMKRIN